MPHDKNTAGDEVILRCTIISIDTDGETQCNVTAEAAERPEGEGYEKNQPSPNIHSYESDPIDQTSEGLKL